MIALATAGEPVGAFVGYGSGVGRFGGRPSVDRLGRYVLDPHRDLDRAQSRFERLGESSVLVRRVLPFVRTFVSIPARLVDMPPLRFGRMTLLGSLVFMTALGTATYELGGRWAELTHGFSVARYILIALVVAAVVDAIAVRYRGMRTERRAAPSK